MPEKITKTKRTAIYIFILAIFMRMAILGITYHGGEDVPYWENIMIAANLVKGNGYAIDLSMRNFMYDHKFFNDPAVKIPSMEGTRPTALKPPIYPLIVAFIFLVFGIKNFLVLFLFQALISALTCLIMYLSLKKISDTIAIIASLGIALYPPFVYHAVSTPENTTLLLFMVLIFLLYIIKLKDKPSLSNWGITGAIGATLTLTEVVTLPFVFLSFGYALIFCGIDKRVALKGITIAITAYILIFSPWILRNYLVFNQIGLIKGGFGQSLMHGLYNTGSSIKLPEATLIALEYEGRVKNEAEEDEALKNALMPLIYKNMCLYVKENVLKNFIIFWWETKKYQDNYSLKYLVGRKIPYALLLSLSLPALAVWIYNLIRNPRTNNPLKVHKNLSIIVIVTFSLTFTIFGATLLRYNFPIQLVLFIFMAETLAYLKNLKIKAYKNIVLQFKSKIIL